MAARGWRMILTDEVNGRPTKAEWLCPDCARRREGSAPLTTGKAKG
jgi:hypothetical protein